jgi:translation initiation factor RLI1
MPKPRAMVDYRKCQPEECDEGICLAASACPKGIVSQEVPHEMPDLSPDVCVGCGICAQACPF